MSNLKLCPDCDKSVSVNAKACPHCGSPFQAQVIEATSKKYKKMELQGCGLIIVAVLALMLAGAIGQDSVVAMLIGLCGIVGFIGGIGCGIVASFGRWWDHG